MPAGVHHGKKDNYIKSDVLEFLKSFDIRVATLECAIGDKPSFDPEKMVRKQDIVYAPTSDLYRVKEMGIDVVSLANNHAFDLGEEGLINTCKQLDKLGIKYCGAGLNSEEASRPAVVTFQQVITCLPTANVLGGNFGSTATIPRNETVLPSYFFGSSMMSRYHRA